MCHRSKMKIQYFFIFNVIKNLMSDFLPCACFLSFEDMGWSDSQCGRLNFLSDFSGICV